MIQHNHTEDKTVRYYSCEYYAGRDEEVIITWRYGHGVANRRGGRFVSGGGFETCNHNNIVSSFTEFIIITSHNRSTSLSSSPSHHPFRASNNLKFFLALSLGLLGLAGRPLLGPVGQLRRTCA